VLVHDRTDGVPNRLVEYAEQRLTRLGRHFDRVQEVAVEFDEESRRGTSSSCQVRITVRTDGRRHPVAHAHETAPEARAALDLALDKVDRQVVKLKEKIKIERKRASVGAGAEEDPADGEHGREVERVRMKLRPESLADAEAAMDASDHPCYVFLDESSGMVCVCYRRPDGGLTVIEPVVP
jgi:putative sigma-54 modulation protein